MDRPATARMPAKTGAAIAIRILPLLLLLTLFPVGWLTTLSPTFDTVMGWLFGTVEAHAIAHATIFLSLGLALLAIVPALRRHPWRYVALMLVFGVAQEALQLLYKQRPIEFDEFRDLGTDAVGFVVALLVQRSWALRVRRRAS